MVLDKVPSFFLFITVILGTVFFIENDIFGTKNVFNKSSIFFLTAENLPKLPISCKSLVFLNF